MYTAANVRICFIYRDTQPTLSKTLISTCVIFSNYYISTPDLMFLGKIQIFEANLGITSEFNICRRGCKRNGPANIYLKHFSLLTYIWYKYYHLTLSGTHFVFITYATLWHMILCLCAIDP